MPTLGIFPGRIATRGLGGVVISAALLCSGGLAAAAEADKPQTNAAEAAWAELENSLRAPQPPIEWQIVQPTDEQISEFRAKYRQFAETAADKARDFYTRFPDHTNAFRARQAEYGLLAAAVLTGATNQRVRLIAAGDELLKQPGLTPDDRFEIRSSQIQFIAMARDIKDRTEAAAAFEKDVRALQKEFPDRPEVWQMLGEIAQQYPPEKARPLLTEIVEGPAPDELKAEARATLKKFDMVGKPLALKFTALDGREVDLEKLKGKVVLIDFWATWCRPCVVELPNVVKLYEKLNPKGFEIIGISLDRQQDKARLENFLNEYKMTWPQYFDGKFWQTKYAEEFEIHRIPTMWLVDKKGNLRDLNARSDLEAKVEKLLAE
ncbi:MAG: TlpA family protein disulfide reductase [Verrucomicrobiae bacterium]|nr:TlpA family protein disulfide reductase [Verrucomicrobiae bacterium]MCX7721497.1 TlpA family protein disulfide reductase [Verrucomicrobiae bacterium]MDW7980098.1 TlpA disulfide reductase family protein [Verrucomicrobiales bacterium]